MHRLRISEQTGRQHALHGIAMLLVVCVFVPFASSTTSWDAEVRGKCVSRLFDSQADKLCEGYDTFSSCLARRSSHYACEWISQPPPMCQGPSGQYGSFYCGLTPNSKCKSGCYGYLDCDKYTTQEACASTVGACSWADCFIPEEGPTNVCMDSVDGASCNHDANTEAECRARCEGPYEECTSFNEADCKDIAKGFCTWTFSSTQCKWISVPSPENKVSGDDSETSEDNHHDHGHLDDDNDQHIVDPDIDWSHVDGEIRFDRPGFCLKNRIGEQSFCGGLTETACRREGLNPKGHCRWDKAPQGYCTDPENEGGEKCEGVGFNACSSGCEGLYSFSQDICLNLEKVFCLEDRRCGWRNCQWQQPPVGRCVPDSEYCTRATGRNEARDEDTCYTQCEGLNGFDRHCLKAQTEMDCIRSQDAMGENCLWNTNSNACQWVDLTRFAYVHHS